MKRIQMTVAYDGTNYCGWQIQSNGITVEEVLNKHLSELLKEDIHVIGASRTDSGVHAYGNVAVFDTETKIPPEKLAFALNQRLPEDIRIQVSFEAASGFHPRRCNSRKTYEYRILNRTFAQPCERLYTHFVYYPLDVDAMQKAAGYLAGEHDFQSFCSARGQAEDTYRTLDTVTVEKTGDRITLRLSGNGFLYNMVRIIAGTLLKVGLHIYPPEYVKEILYAKDRRLAGPKAPARGLTLIGIEFEKQLKDQISSENEEGSYTLWQKEIPETGAAYLEVREYQSDLFPRLLERVARQSMRNGAQALYVLAPQELFENNIQINEFILEKCEKITERGRYNCCLKSGKMLDTHG